MGFDPGQLTEHDVIDKFRDGGIRVHDLLCHG